MRLLSLAVMCLVLIFGAFAAGAQVSDDTLYDQVRIRIANDRETGGGRIEVKVSEGVVELTGKVKTSKQKERAEKLTRKVKGVKEVVNRIEVSPV